jgi:ubiquitin C-terminal hydrolase
MYEMIVTLEDTLCEAVDKVSRVEEFDDGNFPYCENCSAATPHTAQQFISKPSKLLIIQIKRYTLSKMQKWWNRGQGGTFQGQN